MPETRAPTPRLRSRISTSKHSQSVHVRRIAILVVGSGIPDRRRHRGGDPTLAGRRRVELVGDRQRSRSQQSFILRRQCEHSQVTMIDEYVLAFKQGKQRKIVQYVLNQKD